ncbi:MAG: hypothetical protein JJU12_00295 [Chlamydiales bacterium]|nr:hypothetical protein [Chlamydiales bacterium]
MAYIETLAPRGYDPYALFAYPYKEGIRNLYNCDQPTLWGRVRQAAVGILLLIPLINTIAFLILRDATSLPIFNDDTRVVQSEEIPEAIRELNERRNTAIIQQSLYPSIAIIEAEAIEQIELFHVEQVQTHLEDSANRHRDLVQRDGKIYSPRYRRARTREKGLPSANFSQVGGLHQYRGNNHLCGYYALFFMFQAVSGHNQFANRDFFHPMLMKWTDMIAKKRARSWLYSHRDRQIPAALNVSVRGLSRDDIQYLGRVVN